ncbi:unnamed protein product [Caenorhabditis auriculariae]|uniref:Uncharacterized protein n=1 Tax=Caenorhabditis auriculariae TaxID=2777116 RepID=A0A8S1HMT3_9PELO|nr:unnamed protein product [Caenorhabditis auriculariae]
MALRDDFLTILNAEMVFSILEFTPKKRLIINMLILVVALVGGVTATFSAVQAMVNSRFSAPCYARLWSEAAALAEQQRMQSFQHGKIACCGEFRNISHIVGSCLDDSVKLVSSMGGHG